MPGLSVVGGMKEAWLVMCIYELIYAQEMKKDTNSWQHEIIKKQPKY